MMGRFVLCADKDVLLAKGEYIYFYVQARAPELSGAQQAPGSGASISSLKRAAFQLLILPVSYLHVSQRLSS